MWDVRNKETMALSYSNSQNQHRLGSQYNNGRKNNNYQRTYRRDVYTSTKQQPLCESVDTLTVDWIKNSTDNEIVDSKKNKEVLETQRCPLTYLRRSDKPIRKETERLMLSDILDTNQSDEIINLGTAGSEKQNLREEIDSKTRQSMPTKSSNWNEEVNDELDQLISNDSLRWKKYFPLEKGTVVSVTYFDESPTINCWVVQNQYASKRKHLEDAIKRLNGNIETDGSNEIIERNVYSVQYENIYYRCEYLHKINAKEALVGLIDVGKVIQTPIAAIKCLDKRLKSIYAFAFEINFEKPLNLQIGQTLIINSYSLNATGELNVKLGPEEIHSDAKSGQEKKNHTIELTPLQMGVPLELFCLDYSNVGKGYISACIHDPQKIKSIDRLSNKIKDYWTKFGETENYCPNLDEICLVHHDSEGQWYRAECIEVITSDRFVVLFVDYGSTRIVSSSNIRKFVPKFMEPAAIMHLCCISGKFSVSIKQ